MNELRWIESSCRAAVRASSTSLLHVGMAEPMLTRMSVAPGPLASEASPTPARIAEVLVVAFREFSRFLENEVGSRAVSSEILQEALGRGTQKIGVLNSDESAVSWLYRLLRNAVIDQPRGMGSSEPRFTAFRAQVEQQPEPALAVADAIHRYVGEVSTILEPEHATALRSVELGGTSVSAFAESAGLSLRQAVARLSDARAALRRRVVSSSGICAMHGCWNCTCGLGFVGYGQARDPVLD